MDNNERWVQWAVELQSLAQAGLTYGRDVYDHERYERIREISAEMMAHMTDLPVGKVRDLFCGESGYQTPKIDTRAVVFKNDEILLVRENSGKWSLPGGWCDVNVSVGENAVKELKEESGMEAVAERIIAVQDRSKHNLPAYAYGICKIFIECRATGGAFRENIETTECRYFPQGDYPPLATEKTNEEQINMCFAAHHAGEKWQTMFD